MVKKGGEDVAGAHNGRRNRVISVRATFRELREGAGREEVHWQSAPSNQDQKRIPLPELN